jgi:hypothetical protein
MKFAAFALAIALSGMIGCAGKVTSTGTPAAPQASTYITDIEIAVAGGEALVAALPKISAPVKAEVQAGFADLSAGLTCTNTAIASGFTGPVLGLKVTACWSSINIANFSPAAQTYLAAANAGIQALLGFFTPTAAPTVTPADLAKVASLQQRNVAAASKVAK